MENTLSFFIALKLNRSAGPKFGRTFASGVAKISGKNPIVRQMLVYKMYDIKIPKFKQKTI